MARGNPTGNPVSELWDDIVGRIERFYKNIEGQGIRPNLIPSRELSPDESFLFRHCIAPFVGTDGALRGYEPNSPGNQPVSLYALRD